MKPFNLEEYFRDISKKVVTRDGRHVRIVCTNREGNDYPIVALVKDKYGESIRTYLINGRQSNAGDTECDLFFKTEKKEGWINIYKNSLLGTQVYHSEEDALNSRDTYDYVATIKIEWEE